MGGGERMTIAQIGSLPRFCHNCHKQKEASHVSSPAAEASEMCWICEDVAPRCPFATEPDIDEWLLCPESEREPFSEAWFPEIFGQSSSQSTQTEPRLAAVEAAPRPATALKRAFEPDVGPLTRPRGCGRRELDGSEFSGTRVAAPQGEGSA